MTVGAISGHSMGAIGAILAAAADPRVAAVVATSAPADPYRLTRQTFRLAHLPIPDVIAYPARLADDPGLPPAARPPRRGRSARRGAIARYRGPILLAHGADDDVVPSEPLDRLAAAARAARGRGPDAGRRDRSSSPGGQHSWLYEFPSYRARVAAFLATALGGPLEPDEAGGLAAATHAERLPDGEARFAAVEARRPAASGRSPASRCRARHAADPTAATGDAEPRARTPRRGDRADDR